MLFRPMQTHAMLIPCNHVISDYANSCYTHAMLFNVISSYANSCYTHPVLFYAICKKYTIHAFMSYANT